MLRGGVIFALVSLLTCSAAAQAPSIDVRNFSPSVDENSSLALEPTQTLGPGDFNAALVTSYAYRLVTVTDAAGARVAIPLRHQLSYDTLVGLGLGQRLSVDLRMPVVAYQVGHSVDRVGWSPPSNALGDAAVGAKFTLVPRGPLGGFGLATTAHLTVPTGNPAGGLGSGAVSARLRILGELDLVLLALRGSMGVDWRGEQAAFLGDRFKDQMPWALGVVLRPQALGWDQSGRWQWFLESRGSVALTPELATKHSSPAALGIGSRYALDEDFSCLLGMEAPLDGALGAPAFRAVVGLTWAPRFYDADGDGIPDDADDCPEGLPEDRDGFEDDDGCPDEDNDGDGIPDQEDQCPNQAEDLDGYRDQDGCPDPDNDGDSIPDQEDACPGEPGKPSRSKEFNGCPPKDSDHDGILDEKDECPKRPEDRDGYRDQDGCPDLDNDADGVLDSEDDCPDQKGARRSIPGLRGCPDPDLDADSYFGKFGDAFTARHLVVESGRDGADRDQCPEAPEDFDGDRDQDGCPDPDRPGRRTQPLVRIEFSGKDGVVRFSRPPVIEGQPDAPISVPQAVLWRALSRELRFHPDWTALVAVKPQSKDDASLDAAWSRATRFAELLRWLTLRDSSAATVGYASLEAIVGSSGSDIVVVVRSDVRGPHRVVTRASIGHPASIAPKRDSEQHHSTPAEPPRNEP